MWDLQTNTTAEGFAWHQINKSTKINSTFSRRNLKHVRKEAVDFAFFIVHKKYSFSFISGKVASTHHILMMVAFVHCRYFSRKKLVDVNLRGGCCTYDFYGYLCKTLVKDLYKLQYQCSQQTVLRGQDLCMMLDTDALMIVGSSQRQKREKPLDDIRTVSCNFSLALFSFVT